MKTKSALSYFGSDSEVAASLASFLDHCSHVTIPFVGGASILPHLKARAIVANDLNRFAINFYHVASGCAGGECQQQLFERCEHTLSHPSELSHACQILNSKSFSGSWIQAWAYWAVCWIGRKGKGGTKTAGGLPSVRRTANGGTNASRIRAAAEDLREWAKHFERCEWTQVDFTEVLGKVADDPRCGIYCDPPWVGAGDSYLHSFSEADHRMLADMLGCFDRATIVVRYGDDPLIRELYSDAGWTWHDAQSRTQANKVRDEVWIVRNGS